MRRPRPALPLLLALLAAPLSASERKAALTLEAVSTAPPSAPAAAGASWRDARRLTWLAREGEGERASMAMWQIDVATGKKTKLLEPLEVPGAAKGEGKPRTLPLAGSWNRTGTALLLNGEKDLWIWNAETKGLARLTEDADEEELPTFSPDGTRVAFVKKHDLWVADVATRELRRLTTDGSEHVLNGRLGWVYEEELAGRRSGRAYEWSPDSTAIAYLQLDERPVPEFPIVDFLPVNGKLEPQRYPKAGDPNPVPTVGLVTLDGRVTRKVRFEGDVLVAPELSWTADGRSACYLVLDRTQTKVEVRLLPREGAERSLLTESDPAWINAIEPPIFLKDGSFLFLSERSGFLHLYRHGPDGALRNAVTKGEWMVDRSWEVDEAGGWLWFLSTENDPRQRHVARVRLDGTGLQRLTSGRGTHAFLLAPGGAHWLDTYSDLDTPARATLRRAAGAEVATVGEAKSRLEAFRTGTVELGSFRGKDGTLFYTKLLKPADFDPSRRYPVVVSVYGGPHAQVVRDAFPAASPFDHYLASRGFLVFAMDNRGSWGRGHAFETPILKRAGKTELADQLEGVAWLKAQPFVDGERVGIFGWSYGGYMSLYAATRANDVFKVAVAGAPVTDWKLYDSIYAERYMKLPKENEEGYKASSILEAARDLGPKVLVVHGTSDDNVHLQNTLALWDAAARARRSFDFVPLVRQKHGPRDPAMRLYANQRVAEFFEKNL